MDHKQQLEFEIENLRNKLYNRYQNQADDIELVQLSQDLDLLLNQYRQYVNRSYVKSTS